MMNVIIGFFSTLWESILNWFSQIDFSQTMWIEIATIPILLFLSGLFSASETAITGASRARIHHKAKQNQGHADIAEFLIERRERLVAALLLGNNLVNILASVLATAVLLELFGEAGIVYATIVMTILIVLFSELLPKTLALLQPDRALLNLAGFSRAILLLLGPAGITAQIFIRKLVAPTRHRVSKEDSKLAAREELRGTIDLHHIEGSFIKDDKDMLDSILDLDNVDIDHVMVHRTQIVMANADLPTRDLIKQILQDGHTRIPLWRNHQENIIGILHAKDVLNEISNNDGNLDMLNLEQIMREPWFILRTTSLRKQLRAFLQGKSHCALVVDEYGDLMGLVTLEDILEEIVGEISDEHDLTREHLQKNKDGSVIVDGALPIRMLNRTLGWKLPDDSDTSTLAGLVIKHVGKIPHIGDSFDLLGIHVDIVRRNNQKITTLRLRKLA